MTIHTVEHSPDEPPRLSLLPLISGGLAVALVVAVSLSLWQRTDRGSAAPTEGTAPHIGDMTDFSAVPTATARAVPPRVYLVESLERQRLLADLGLSENEMVVVVTTEEDADQVRSSLSRPGTTVVDLRTLAAAAPPPLTVFLVDSEEQRAAVQADLAAAVNPLRAHDGPQSSRVINTATPHGEQVARAMVGEASEVRPDGQPAMTLIDLRTP